MIKAENVVYEYIRRDSDNNVTDIVKAIDDVSFVISKGQFVSIVGHNGSGKSTLAKHLNGLLKPTEGIIWIDGIDTSKDEMMLEVRQTTGMIFQNPDNQIVSGIVEEDVAFGPENIGIPTEEIGKRVEESLKMVGMYEYREMSPNRLSGGQKQRIGIAGVLAMKPSCIVLDEPTAMLDPGGRKEVLKAIKKLNDSENITIVLITHNMEETLTSDVIMVMNNGKIVMSGTPEYIFSKAALLEKCGLELPEIVKIAEGLRQKGINIPQGVLTIDDLTDAIINLR